MSGQMRLCGGGVVEGACVRGRMGVREVVWAADCGFLRSGNMSVGFRIGQSKTVVFFFVCSVVSHVSSTLWPFDFFYGLLFR